MLTHPTTDELLALSLGRLGEPEMERVSVHLGECPECCGKIDRLSAADPLVERLRESAARPEEAIVGPSQRRSAVRALRRGNLSRGGSRADGSDHVPPVLPMLTTVGDYDILAEVGRGGMGIVYKAVHRGLNRVSALKMVLAGEFASRSQELRFRLEAELASRVQHPNIVQVYEIGREQGRHFLAMEWVDGGSLAERLDGSPWPPGDAAILVETVARAIHEAHVRGVIHRDLKPANILLQRPDDSPRIADFGLARATEGGLSLTRSGTLVGTPGYMAPEQAGGSRRGVPIGPATDIYALGVILYQLLTGLLPFDGESALDVLRAVTSDEPARPRRLRPGIPRDLEAITLHCLQKEPQKRYPSALALADDLRAYLGGGKVSARPVGPVARLARAARRSPVAASLLIMLALSLVGGLAGVTWKWLEADEQRLLADASARRAEAERVGALRQAYRARLSAAAASLAAHDVAAARGQLDAAPAPLRGWEWRHLRSRLDDSASVLELPAGGSGLLVPGRERLRVGVHSGDTLRLAEPGGAEAASIPISSASGKAVASAETTQGTRFLFSFGDGFDLVDQSGRSRSRFKVPGGVQPRVALSPDGSTLAWPKNGEGWSRLRLADAATGEIRATCEGHRENIWAFAFSPDGRRVATGGEDRTAKIWDARSGKPMVTFQGHLSKVLGVAFSPDGKRLLTTSADGTVRQWDAELGKEVEPAYDRHSGNVTAASYSPDGLRVASTGTDRTVRVWNAAGREDVAVLHGHTGNVTHLAFDPDGHRLATLSADSMLSIVGDETIRGWDVDPRVSLPILRGHEAEVYPVAYSPDGLWIASGGWDRTARLWDAATGELVATLPHPDVVHDLAFAPDGSWFATASLADGRLRIWDAATARLRKEIALPAGSLREVHIRPDGRRVAVSASAVPQVGNRVFVCDVDSGEVVFTKDTSALGYSPDGRWLAVRDDEESAVVFLNAETHADGRRFTGHESRVASIAFSADGSQFASCGRDRTVRVWRVDGGPPRLLRGHSDEVFAVAFHPDGTRLASAGRDRSVWLWDLDRGEEVVQLQGHSGYIWSLAFSPDGSTLASGSGDFTVRLWDTAPLKERHSARRDAESHRPEAEALVASRLRDGTTPSDLAAAIRRDASLTPPRRRAILRAILRGGANRQSRQ